MNEDNKLSQYPCYFTWEWANCTKRSKLFLNDRIETIEGTIQSEEKMEKSRNLPQLYALNGYLYTQLYRKEDGERKLLNRAEICFQTALQKCGSEDDGYKKIIYASLIHLFDLIDEKSKVNDNISKFDDQEPKVELGSNEQVLAIQGHGAAYLHKYHEAITFYEMAMERQKEMEKQVTPEWLFGLALAYIHRNVGKATYSEMEKIEYLLRHAISLDPTYDYARLKLANHLWDSRVDYKFGGKNECNAKEEIDDIINQVKKSQSENITILEEIASTINRMDPKEALKLFEKCYKINPKSQKTLRGLGNLHLNFSKKEKKNSANHLEKAVQYFTENIEKSKNAKPHDLSQVSKIHRDAYLFYKNRKNVTKAKDHESKSKEWIEKLKDQLKKGFLDERNEPEICYRISEHHKAFGDQEKEIQYLNKTLSCAVAGREEDDLKGLKFVDQAQNRLLKIASKSDKAECFKTKSDVFKQRGNFDSAIFYLQKALSESQENQQLSSFQLFEMRVEEIQLFINLIRKKREYSLDDGDVTTAVREKIDALDTDPRHANKRAQLEFAFQELSIEKLFNDKDMEHVGDLRRSRLAFEENLKVKNQDQSLDDAIFDVCHDSKVVLERCMRYIRENVFPDGKEVTYYPNYLSDLDQTKLDTVLEKIGWNNFSSTLPSLVDFLVDRLDNAKYPDLKFVKIRNKGEHDFKAKQIQILWQHCPDKEDRIRLARFASRYAVEVWNKVKHEIDKYIEQL